MSVPHKEHRATGTPPYLAELLWMLQHDWPKCQFTMCRPALVAFLAQSDVMGANVRDWGIIWGPQNPWKNSQSNKNTFLSRTRSSKVELSWETVPTLRAFFNFKRVGLYCEPLDAQWRANVGKTPRIWNFWNSRKCCKFLCEPKSASLLGVYSYFFFYRCFLFIKLWLAICWSLHQQLHTEHSLSCNTLPLQYSLIEDHTGYVYPRKKGKCWLGCLCWWLSGSCTSQKRPMMTRVTDPGRVACLWRSGDVEWLIRWS